jgi:acyl-CoA synthetase (NDP forming)
VPEARQESLVPEARQVSVVPEARQVSVVPEARQDNIVPEARQDNIARMLAARSVAVVGASARPGSFGARMLAEVSRSPAKPEIYPVNPRYGELGGRRCHASLDEVPAGLDLVMLGVPDSALEEQLGLAAARGAAAAVIFGSAVTAPGDGLRGRLAAITRTAGMALCGAGCMGFVNVTYGLRAIGYAEPDPLPAGPVALVTHSGSVFSALLRARRGFGFTLAVSSGQELVTPAPAYLEYALGLEQTSVLALVLEAIREPDRLHAVLARAAESDVPVALLTAGESATGRAMVEAHSGALAGTEGGWEALCRAYGVHRVGDLAELADTLEVFAAGARRAASPRAGPPGLATVHDSGLERAHTADLADRLGVAFAPISERTKAELADLLDPGLEPANPLDVWGRGSGTRELFASALRALANDPAVSALALSVDLVPEFDGDDSYPLAALDAAAATGKPLAVLASLPSAIDPDAAARLRRAGIPVLEGTRSGLIALRHLLDRAAGPAARPRPHRPDSVRARRAAGLLDELGPAQTAGGPALFALLREYGIRAARTVAAASARGALAAAERIGYPVVLKTAEPAIAHKTEAGGVILNLTGPDRLAAAYTALANRLGPNVQVCEQVPAGTELALGITSDPALGPLVVVGAGGILVEMLADRAVALPPVDRQAARELLAALRVSRLLAGARGAPPADLDAILQAIIGVSELAAELGGQLGALDINPLICGPAGAIAVDALAVLRRGDDGV